MMAIKKVIEKELGRKAKKTHGFIDHVVTTDD